MHTAIKETIPQFNCSQGHSSLADKSDATTDFRMLLPQLMADSSLPPD